MSKIIELMKIAMEEDNSFFGRNYQGITYNRLKNKFYVGVNRKTKSCYVIMARSHIKAMMKLAAIENTVYQDSDIIIPFEIIFVYHDNDIRKFNFDDNTIINSESCIIKLRATKCGPYDYGFYTEMLFNNDLWRNIFNLLYNYGIYDVLCDTNTKYYYLYLSQTHPFINYDNLYNIIHISDPKGLMP